jgi:hypothetical protein
MLETTYKQSDLRDQSMKVAREQRRRVHAIIRAGDESKIGVLLDELGEFLSLHLQNKETKDLLNAAMEAARGIPVLSGRRQLEQKFAVKSLKAAYTPEELLIRVLRDGPDRLQCAAADVLARIGTQNSVSELAYAAGRPDPITGKPNDGDADVQVQAHAKMALRRIDFRSGTSRVKVATRSWTQDELDLTIHAACAEDNFDVTQVESDRYKVKVTLPEGRKQTVYIKTGGRHTQPGQTTPTDYVVLYTPCGPANEKLFRKVLELNALALNSQQLEKSELGFSKGSLGVVKDEIVMLETESHDTLSIASLRTGIEALSVTGDFIESQITGGGDKR